MHNIGMGHVAQAGYLAYMYNLFPGVEFPLHMFDCHLCDIVDQATKLRVDRFGGSRGKLATKVVVERMIGE